MTDEWNKWNSQASPQEYRTNLLSKSQQYESNLRTLANKAGALSAPSGLSDLKDLTASAINKYIESFAAAQDYARSPTNDSVRRKAEVAQLEGNKLLGLAADKWDEGLARYGIKPSEIGQ